MGFWTYIWTLPLELLSHTQQNTQYYSALSLSPSHSHTHSHPKIPFYVSIVLLLLYIIICRNKDMEFEIESLSRSLNTAEKKVVSLERDVALGELERFKLEEILQRSQRKCEELEETVTRLLEDKKLSELREKRAEERCEKISDENSKMSYEFHNSISELNETIKQLKNKNLENERLIGVFQEKYEGALKKMGQEIVDLGGENLKAVETIEELGRENVENKKTIEELRLKNTESDKLASAYKSRLENLSLTIKKIEVNLANLRELTTNYNDILDSKSKKGDRNSDQPWARGEDDNSHNTVKTSRGSQLGRSSLKPESNGCKSSPGSGAHASDTRLMSGEGCFGKITRSSSVARDIVEIVDSDDEPNPDGANDNMGENEMKFVQCPSSSKRSKRSQREDLFSHSTTKRKRN
ncbi:hypothetical protein CASFOL_036774 [Castilleja foliolosa]|uniref:Uncharacterized protein n=1 Tax=Castilleja foliolosa TaxID=1961234 RepID=A0ABD3BPT0_9LAMI